MMFLNLEAPIHRYQLMTWVHPPQLSTAFPLSLAWGPMHTALMSLSAQGTAWLLPHPRQSHSSSLGHPGLAQLLSTRETPPNSLYVQLYQGDRIGQLRGHRIVCSCLWGSPPSSSAPSARQSPRQPCRAPGEGREQGTAS